VLLGPDDISGPLHIAASGGNTVPDPPLAEEAMPDVSNSIADSEAPLPLTTQEESEWSGATNRRESEAVGDAPEPPDARSSTTPVLPNSSSAPSEEYMSIIGLAGDSLSSSPVVSAVDLIIPQRQPDEDETSFDAAASDTAHPTAPMGSVDAYLPVPGSMTSLASGPLLAASLNMDHELEDVYKNTGPMATQRLEGDLQFDQTDRPTSINLTMSSIPNRDDLSHDWGASTTPTSAVPRTGSDDQKKPRMGNSANRTASPKAAVDDPIAKMKQLKALLDAGFITDEDYAAKKAEILSRI
jgi:hypothetical protein